MPRNPRRDKEILVTDLEEKFCQEYMKCQNIAKAYEEASGTKDDSRAYEMWKRNNVQARVAVLRVQAVQAMKIEVNDIVKGLMKVYEEAMAAADFTNANRAMENLGKYLGMFVEKKVVNQKVDVHTSGESVDEVKDDVKRLVGVLGQDNVVKLFNEK